MKYDLNGRQTKGAQRTLKTFRETLVKLLSKSSFDVITVQQICDESLIPRATFYNYFDDKFDLLDYLFKVIEDELTEMMNGETDYKKLIEYIIDYMDEHHSLFAHILKNNNKGTFLYDKMYRILRKSANEISKAYVNKVEYTVPMELVAELNSSAILVVLEWVFIERNTASKEEILDYTLQLLNRESLMINKSK